MDERFSTHTLFNCSLKDINKDSDVIEIMESRLKQSLRLLSTVIQFIIVDKNLSEEAIKYLGRFERIKSFNGKKLPPIAEKYWSIEEITLLIIMLRTITRKRYNSMEKTVKKFMTTGKPPTNKVLISNQEWLLEAYKCLGLLKHTKWSKKIDEELLMTTSRDISVRESLENIKKVELAIIKSGVLEGELDSVIGQILAKCAYPELLKENQKSYAVQLVEAVSEVIFALEKIKGVIPQTIAVNESIKQLRKLTEDIGFSYDISKYYTDSYWESVMDDVKNEDTLSVIKKMLTEKYAVELDTIEKNTL